jgi:peptidoglycan/LPS O-acetylase OafA/YrhL
MAAYGFSLVAAFYAVSLLIVICQPGLWLSTSLKTPILLYFGKVSYAIYIFHQGLRGLLDRILPPFGPRLNAVRVLTVLILAVLATVALAELSWQ